VQAQVLVQVQAKALALTIKLTVRIAVCGGRLGQSLSHFKGQPPPIEPFTIP